MSHPRPFNIYTDGSTVNNGQPGARGGYGVVCESDRSLDRAGSYNHGNQTNNRYELEAIKHATEIARHTTNPNINIKSDSKYALDSINNWSNNWERNGWRTATGQPVQNQDLIRDIKSNVSDLRASGKNVGFEHVRGHQNDYHNNEADRLARGAANSNNVHNSYGHSSRYQ
uniref:RNase H domain-containing protein n=1 Tax=Caenorhabditis tropicalis TaxID=1561998 RepID=A0A1I7UUL6_9PELO